MSFLPLPVSFRVDAGKGGYLRARKSHRCSLGRGHAPLPSLRTPRQMRVYLSVAWAATTQCFARLYCTLPSLTVISPLWLDQSIHLQKRASQPLAAVV